MDADLGLDGVGDAEANMADAVVLDQNMDDLFGDAADSLNVDALNAALPSISLPPELILRVMDKQIRGCCTKLAWSNTGSIAQISAHGREIVFMSMCRDARTGHWSLTEPCKSKIAAPEGAVFEHIQFSGIGVDLATADSRGIVRIYTLTGTLGSMVLASTNIVSESVEQPDLDVVVGLHWLPTHPNEFRAPYISPANKIGDRWVTEMRSRNPAEQSVRNPADTRHAMCYISRNAKLTLMYQIEAIWHAVSIELESPASSSELLTHASVGENGDHLLAVTHDIGRRFRLYKISITWNESQNTRPGGHPYKTVNPTLHIERLTMLDHIAAQQADLASLSDLWLISSTPSHVTDHDPSSTPTIFAIFAHAAQSTDLTVQPEAFSVVARWQVEAANPTLHESFAKKPSSLTQNSTQTTILRRQEDVVTSKIILDMDPKHHNTILAFCTSDASTEFRDRGTMSAIQPYGESTIVSSLPQTGFEHMVGGHHSDAAMSPDGSILIVQRIDGTLGHKLMSLRYSWQALDFAGNVPSELVEAAVVCLARQYAILSCAQIASDDVLALLPNDLSSELRALFVYEVVRMTNRIVDIALIDPQKQQIYTFKEALLRLAMSASYVISRVPGTQKPTWASKYAFCFLSLRSASTLMQILSRPDIFMHTPMVHSLRGIARWSCDLLVYIADSLITLARAAATASKGQDMSARISAFVSAANKLDNPVLNLVLSTFTRAFLRFILTALKRYINLAQQSLPYAKSLGERTDLEEMLAFFAKLPFKLATMETLIIDIDSSIRATYTSPSSTATSDRRIEIELQAVTSPQSAPEHGPVLQGLLETNLPKFTESVDQSKLYFYDTTWLGIEDRGVKARREWDVVRKLPIPSGAKLRVCRRCGSVVEDVTPEKMREKEPWMFGALRNCVCGCYWIAE